MNSRWPLIALLLAFAACKPPEPEPSGPVCAATTADAAPFRMLTRAELDRTLADLVGDTSRPAAARLPNEPLVYGFDNNSRLHTANDTWVAASFELAEDVALRAVKDRKPMLVTCATFDAACGNTFVESFGRKAFRRALKAEELAAFKKFFANAFAKEGFDAALEQTLTVFLQSPQFLYRPEVGLRAIVPGSPAQLEPSELASKLSYFLWGSMPDEALLAAAENGELDTPAGIEKQARRLLASPRAQAAATDFFSRYFTLDALARVEKDVARFPSWVPRLQTSWKQSMQLYFGEVAKPGGTLAGLLSTPALYVDSTMSMYAPNASTEFQRVTMTAAGRSGVLAQPGLLARLASPDQGSPVRRGVFVFDRLLCQALPLPPPEIDTTPPPPKPGATTRERFAVHGTTAGCTGCHERIDPMGFGFEHFDGMGVYRDKEEGKDIDSSGAVIGTRDSALRGAFDGVDGLSTKLAKSRQVHDCLSSQWYRWALGRVEAESDACALDKIQAKFFDTSGSFEELQLAIVGSDAFRFRSGGNP